ncbi:MAG: anti-sigma factor [Luteimonas sp.]
MNTDLPSDMADIPDSDDLIAAEYMLGLLDADAHRDALTRLERDAGFAAQVAAWETYFTPWLEAIAPVDVPAALWSRIRTALWQHELPQRRAAVAAAAPSTSLWNRLGFWRGLAGGGIAVAAISLAALFVTLNRAPTPVPIAAPVAVVAPVARPAAAAMVVSLRHDDGTMAYTATVDADTGVITLIPAFMPEDARVPELWLIAGDGVPKSLGVVARDHAQRVVIPERIRRDATADAVFAVSLEPAGGSPTGSPTGPVVAKGSLIRL